MKFDTISYTQWAKDIPMENVPYDIAMKWYRNIQLPKQGTENSMGVDFFVPYNIRILAHNKVKIPTGVRWICDFADDKKYGLLLVPRSSTGIKLGLRLLNTVGVVDADYYKADNEGHIMLFFENTTDEDVYLEQGKAIAQGLVVPYIIPQGATSDIARHGGFGSTDDNKK